MSPRALFFRLSLIGIICSLSACETVESVHAPKAPVATPLHTLRPANANAARRNALIEAGIRPIRASEIDAYMSDIESQIRADFKGSAIQVERHHDDIVVFLPGDQSFGSGSANLEPRIMASMAVMADIVRQNPATYIDITGHADASGLESGNRVLSEQRARSVAGFLVDHKVTYQRLFVAGLGSTRPIAPNSSPEGRAQNRRVEIILRPLY